MAFPTIPTAGASTVLFTETASAGTTHTFPSLTTLGNANGDLLIAFIVLYQASATGNAFGTWGGSFTEFGDSSSATNPSIAMGAAYKISDGTETGTFTVVSTISGRAAMCLMSVKNWHGTTIPEVAFSGATVTTAQDPPNLDPGGWAAEDTLWIVVAGGGQTSLTGSWGGITSAPASYTNYAEGAIAGGDAIGACQIAVAFQGVNAAAENPGSFTTDTSPEIERAATIAVRPAGATVVSDTDSAAASESGPGPAIPSTDSVAATDALTTLTAAATGTDSAALSEGVPLVNLTATDSAAVTDQNGTVTAILGITDSDSATVSEASILDLTGADSITYTEPGSVTAAGNGTDSAGLSEAYGLGLDSSDSAVFSESGSVQVTGGGTVDKTDTDSATVSESGSVTAASTDTDSMTLTEIVSLAITLVDTDSIVLTDAGTVAVVVGEALYEDGGTATPGGSGGGAGPGVSGSGSSGGHGGSLVVVADG